MRFRALDGWRGLCALFVAIYHLNVASHFYLTPLRIGAYVFVDFFFVLSGFVMAHCYARQPMRQDRAVAFLVRRIGRLWPLHAVVLALLVLMECAKLVVGDPASGYRPFGIDAVSPWAILTNLLLVHALDLHSTLTWNFVSWSICVEFWAYVAFVTAVLALPRTWLATGFLTLSLLAGLLLTRTPGGMESVYDFGVLRCAYGFFAGCFLRMVMPGQGLAMGRAGATVLEIATVAGMLAFVVFGAHTPAGFTAPLVFGALVVVFAQEAGALSRLLTSRPVQVLGETSYSIYLVHVLVLALVSRLKMLQPFWSTPIVTLRHFSFAPDGLVVYDLGSPWIMDGVTLAYAALLVSAATVTYRAVEVPGQRLFNDLAGRLAGAMARNVTRRRPVDENDQPASGENSLARMR